MQQTTRKTILRRDFIQFISFRFGEERRLDFLTVASITYQSHINYVLDQYPFITKHSHINYILDQYAFITKHSHINYILDQYPFITMHLHINYILDQYPFITMYTLATLVAPSAPSVHTLLAFQTHHGRTDQSILITATSISSIITTNPPLH